MSGKATARTKAKHERRMSNDIASVRNFLESLYEKGSDCQWTSIILKILNCRAQISWPRHQNQCEHNIPFWFWHKVQRIISDNDIAEFTEIDGQPIYVDGFGAEPFRTGGFSTVSKISVGPTPRIAFAQLLGIDFRCTPGWNFELHINDRRRTPIFTELKTKTRPAKPTEFASTEEIDMKEQKISVDDMLEEISDMQQKIREMESELAKSRTHLARKKERVREHLSNIFNI